MTPTLKISAPLGAVCVGEAASAAPPYAITRILSDLQNEEFLKSLIIQHLFPQEKGHYSSYLME